MAFGKKKALILGLSGSVGIAAAVALARRGYAIDGLARDPARAAQTLARRAPGLAATWHRGDALDPSAVMAAASGASVVLHGANPPKYRRWREDGLPMLANALAAAQANDARLLFPGNVYVFAPDAGTHLDESAPKNPRTVKGRIRVEMEAMLARSGARTAILRAGDYFGPGADNTWFAQIPVRKTGRIVKLHDLETARAAHSWAYLPDLGEAFAELAERDATLETHAVFHFRGHRTDAALPMAAAIAQTLGADAPPVRAFPWLAFRLVSPFVGFVREALEMRWLWTNDLLLDNRKLVATIGAEPHTPLDRAIAMTLAAATPAAA